ncbi:hypothetical protein FHR70_003712 [Microvirga lupini]|uniref:Uncharacterized protein n=1 Tax=Microvirga lupini TaxID=420324 RepID=A0A7W4VPF9_9HYPH|nr:hypothetical protein [Microvirga lupini]MBB3020626.1 hypothetical protein [Microvirga lupini]
MDWNSMLNDLWNIAITIITLMIPIIVPPLVIKLLDKLGADADANRRQAVINAFINGLIGALASRGFKAGDVIPPEVKARVLAETAGYVKQTVPDTLKKLGVPDGNLVDIANTHLPQVLGQFGPAGALIGTMLAAEKKA